MQLSARDRVPDAANTNPEIPIWPSGIARFTHGVLDVTTGEGVRVAARDITEIGVDRPRAGRLSLRLRYRAGLDRVRTSFWVEPEHRAALQRLVDTVATAKAEA